MQTQSTRIVITAAVCLSVSELPKCMESTPTAGWVRGEEGCDSKGGERGSGFMLKYLRSCDC